MRNHPSPQIQAGGPSNDIRHFTVTGILLHEDKVLLVENRKAQLFLCPGGHVEPNEDPVTALRRELREEVGLEIEIIADDRFAHSSVKTSPEPFTVVMVDIPAHGTEPAHQHIDFVYAVRPLSLDIRLQDEELASYRWVSIDEVAQTPTPTEYPDLVMAVAKYVATHS